MKILLVNTSTYPDVLVYPIGLDYLVSFLHQNGYKDVDMLDLAIISASKRKQALLGLLMSNSYDLIGFSFRNLTDQLYQGNAYTSLVKKLIELTRQVLDSQENNTKIVVGGTAFSLLPDELLDLLGADYGVAGEGEAAFLDLIEKIKADKILEKPIIKADFSYKNQSYSRGSWGHLSSYQEKSPWGNLQTKRGCSRRCIYCSYPVIEGKIFRMRDPKIVAEEYLQLERLGFEKVYLVDATFNTPMLHAVRVMEAWKEAKTTIPWKGFFNPMGINEDFLELVKATHGDEQMNFTVESGSSKMLEILKKDFEVKHISRAAQLCKKAGIPFGFTILFGAPGETKKTVQETCRLMRQLNPSWISASIGVYVYPHTKLAEETKGKLWHNPSDLLDAVVQPYDRDMIKREVEIGLEGSGIKFMIYDELEFFTGG